MFTSFMVLLEAVGLGEGAHFFMRSIYSHVTVLLKYDLRILHVNTKKVKRYICPCPHYEGMKGEAR
jgi:hypothetical protein